MEMKDKCINTAFQAKRQSHNSSRHKRLQVLGEWVFFFLQSEAAVDTFAADKLTADQFPLVQIGIQIN